MSNPRPNITTGMILAAGFGKRLRPLTRFMPKPLIPFLGKPLLFHAAERLKTGGVTRIAVNLHYKADMIENAVRPLREDAEIALFHENPILGTGGGPANAAGFLQQDRAVVLYNGDVFSTLDVGELIHAHDAHQAMVTLALIPDGHDNKIRMDEKGTVTAIADKPNAPYTGLKTMFTYTGISVLSAEFIRNLPHGYSELAPALIRMIREQPGSVRGYVQPGLFWSDMGTLGRYLKAHKEYLSRNPEVAQRRDRAVLHQAPTASISPRACLKGIVCAGPHSEIQAKAVVEDSVILENACVRQGDNLFRSVAGKGFTIQDVPKNISDLEIFNTAADKADLQCTPLELQGSDRIFYRIQTRNESVILMQFVLDDGDFANYTSISEYLSKRELGVPEIIRIHRPQKSVLLQDLGDQSLYRKVTGSAKPEIERLYKDTIEFLIAFQNRGTRKINECPAAAGRQLDRSGLRWETAYFAEMFLQKQAGIDPRRIRTLTTEFNALAHAAAALPQTLIHRDFQSQNILLSNGRVWIVDFQGARKGPVTYDIASLLNDPYVALDGTVQGFLADYYAENARRAGLPVGDPRQFQTALILCSLQRGMQALGAYGFLANVKQREYFRQFIPPGLRLLQKTLSMNTNAGNNSLPLPELTRLINSI